MKHFLTIIALALSITLKAQQVDPNFEKGLIKFNQNDFQASVELFTKSIKQSPTNLAYYKRAKAYQRLGSYDAALNDINQILLKEPLNKEAIDSKTLLYYLKDDYKSMADNIKRNINNGIETEHNSRFYLAIAYEELGKTDSSSILLELHLKQKPDDVDALSYRSGLSIVKLEFDSALADLDKIIKLDTTYKDAYFSRGFAKTLMGQYSVALPDLDKAEKLGFEDLTLIFETRGDAYKELGDSLKAASEYDKALNQANGPDYELMIKRAKLAYYQFDDNQTAFDLMTRVIQGSKELTAEVYYIRACSARELKKLEQSEADFKKYAELAPKSRAHYIQWAYLKAEQMDWPKVMEYSNEYLKGQKVPSFGKSVALSLIGKALYEQKSIIEATKTLEEALKLDDENPDAHFWLAKIFIELNKADEACEHFVKAYELGHLAAKDELMNHCDYAEDDFEE